MAGDWIKMELSTPDKPEVLAITARMGWDDPDLTVGKLFKLWRWFDQHTVDGNARGVTSPLLDRQIGATGFITAVAEAGWLSITEAGIVCVGFEKHNGASAKSRAQTAKRVASHRSNAESNAPSVTPALAREEKRREEIQTPPQPSVVSLPKTPRGLRKVPTGWELTPELVEWSDRECPGVLVLEESAKFRDHTFSRAISDWDGAWRNWMRNAHKFSPAKTSGRGQPAEPAWRTEQRDRVAAFAGAAAAKHPNTTMETIDAATRFLG